MQQEGAVGDALHVHARKRSHALDDALAVLGVGSVHGDVADGALASRAHEIDRAEVAAGPADRARDLREAAGRGGDDDADREAVRGGGGGHDVDSRLTR